MHSVNLDPKWEQDYNTSLGLITEFYSTYSQDAAHYNIYQEFDKIKNKLSDQQRRTLELCLKDFIHSGVNLPKDKRAKYQSISKKLALLSNQFEQNITKSAAAWDYFIKQEDKHLVQGLNKNLLMQAQEAANKSKKHTHPGWLFKLDFPTYFQVLTQADNSKLREIFFKAWNTRASDQAKFAAKWDNSKLISDILQLRLKLAKLMNYPDFAAYTLDMRMCKQTQDALNLLTKIANKAKKHALDQWQELESFANQKLNAWDILFFSEKMQQAKFGISQEQLREYFPLNHVLTGLIDIIQQLFNLKIKVLDNTNCPAELKPSLYHKDIKILQITRADKASCLVILDLFARPAKRAGAWMGDVTSRMRINTDNIIQPIATVTCNFQNSPSKNIEPTLTHDDVITLFHEMGHALQHVLTTIDYLSISGISHVPWDAVEVCSQFLENYCWEPEVLVKLSCHTTTQQSIPEELITKLIASKNFNSGLHLIRQVQLGLFDLDIHKQNSTIDYNQACNTMHDIRTEYNIYTMPDYIRTPESFSHIFAGGYAAGYYSYLWAEVISCNLLYKFKQTSLFDSKLANQLRCGFYESGGAEDPNILCKQFCGKGMDITDLLKHYAL